jgi:regulator of nucleoside diphosphate kinase
MRQSPIFITPVDAARLRSLIAARRGGRGQRDQDHLLDLSDELERANVVEPEALPEGIVLLQSRVNVTDLASWESQSLTLVLPHEADAATGHISVLAPIGCALMGCRKGDVIEWETPGGWRRLRIDDVSAPGRDLPADYRRPAAPEALAEARP